MAKKDYKNGRKFYSKDMFDSSFDGYADIMLEKKLEEEQKKAKEEIRRKKEEELKAKEAEKKFWEEHPNDGWLF